MRTKERLAKDLSDYRAPQSMVAKALMGHYDDFESPLPDPITQLVEDCRSHDCLCEIAQRAREGCYDATKEEADEWLRKTKEQHEPG